MMRICRAVMVNFLSELILLTKGSDRARESHKPDCEGCVLRDFAHVRFSFAHRDRAAVPAVYKRETREQIQPRVSAGDGAGMSDGRALGA